MKEIYNEIFNELCRDNPNVKIEVIYLTGSSLFFEDPRDKDYVVVADNVNFEYKRFLNIAGRKIGAIDYFVYSKGFFDSLIRHEKSPLHFFQIIEWLSNPLIKDEHIVYGKRCFGDKTILDNKEYIRRETKKVLDDFGLLKPERYENTMGYFHKSFYWVYLILKFLKNNNFEIDQETTSVIRDLRLRDKENYQRYRKWILEELNKK